jgi:hypothetical protein
MIVKEAGDRSLERRRLQQVTDGAGTVEELALKLGGNSIPAHEHGRAQAFQDLLLLLLGERRTAVAVLDPLNGPIAMNRHPFFFSASIV